ncbi:MAG: hypothetical protein O3C21_16115 [Verrucomicrobia bacterium]|nr:hypothetical protein [Verrucomicrobiota bacterium]
MQRTHQRRQSHHRDAEIERLVLIHGAAEIFMHRRGNGPHQRAEQADHFARFRGNTAGNITNVMTGILVVQEVHLAKVTDLGATLDPMIVNATTQITTAAVPEPSSLIFLVLAAFGAAWLGRYPALRPRADLHARPIAALRCCPRSSN